jgi:hypothetical protein
VAAALEAWFEDYLSTFAALGRGDRDDPQVLLEFYAVPLLLTADDTVLTCSTGSDVIGAFRPQIAALRADGYDHSESLGAQLTLLNERTALYDAAFIRRRGDGAEIGRLRATDQVTDGESGRRIAARIVRPDPGP